jgi:hypothetical protein
MRAGASFVPALAGAEMTAFAVSMVGQIRIRSSVVMRPSGSIRRKIDSHFAAASAPPLQNDHAFTALTLIVKGFHVVITRFVQFIHALQILRLVAHP